MLTNNTLQKYLAIKKYSNVIVQVYPSSPEYSYDKICLQCTVCNAHLNLKYHFYDFNTDLDIVEAIDNDLDVFAKDHEHKVNQTTQVHYDNKFIENLKANTPLNSLSQGNPLPVNKLNDIQFFQSSEPAKYTYTYTLTNTESGPSTYYQPVYTNPVNERELPSSVLKEIFKLSNLNVDIQFKNSYPREHRALCEKCGSQLLINFQEVMTDDRSNETWKALTKFCKTHRHEVVVEEIRVGRKFKNAI